MRIFSTIILSLIVATTLLTTPAHASPIKEDMRLAVPFLKQEQRLSCEIATLRMVLAYSGISVPEKDLIARLPFDTTPKKKGVWGDPQKGFVGKINGTMLGTGYGVYSRPLMKAASHWGNAQELKNATPSDLAYLTSQNIPVIVWGYYQRGTPATWKTPEGRTIKAVDGEHTRVVVGFKGTIGNPEGFYIIDPVSGMKYWTRTEWEKNWKSLDNMAIIVTPKP